MNKLKKTENDPNTKMMSFRMRKEMFIELKKLREKIEERTGRDYSQSKIIEIALATASTLSIKTLLDSYADTFKFKD